MPHISFTDPVPGDPDSTEEPKIPTALDAIKTAINGNLGSGNLLDAFAQTLLVGAQAAGASNVWIWNVGTLTFTGPGSGLSSDTNPQTIAHGLTVVPFLVFCQTWGLDSRGAPAGGIGSGYGALQWTTTNAFVQARYLAGDWPSSYTIEAGWLALGIAANPDS
jgi:hypothetical protein